MALIQGTQLGRYEIRSLLGTGGMGEVYLGRDEKLQRDVAIKVLPPLFSKDVNRLRRFEQEAQITGTLNHPNILAVYDVGMHEEAPYVVSELLEGETLRNRLRGTALAQRRAIDYALQIIKGLAAAHEKGIIHRDLKPDNIFITNDGRVKILDFGLAKFTETNSAESQTDVATRRVDTDSGIVMGTAGYMSPEQIRCQTVDQRADIFAFGAVLYEMLSGRRAFHGESAADTVSAILREDPRELSTITENISPAVERLVNHCLEKNPQERFQSARDVGFALETITGTSGQVTTSTPLRARSKNGERLVWIIVTAALLMATLFALFLNPFRAKQIEAHRMRFNVTLPERATFFSDVETHNLALSPDGRRLAFIATRDANKFLWLLSLDELSPQPVPGTEGAYSPFWSPDNRYLAFFAQGRLHRLDVTSSVIQTLCSLSGEIDTVGTWGREGVILFNDQFNDPLPSAFVSTGKSTAGIYSVPASGGTPTLLTKSPKYKTTWVHFLPDGKRFLFYGRGDQPEANGIYAASLDSPEGTLLLNAGYTRVEYASPGYLLYVRDGTLLAQPFDEKNLQVKGEPFAIVSRLPYFDKTGWAEFSAVSNSVLAYSSNRSISRIVWLDRSGRTVGQLGTPSESLALRISPDGQSVSLAIVEERTGSSDTWIYDLARDTGTRFAFGPSDDGEAVWSPDGRRLAYFSCCDGSSTLYIKERNDVGKGQSPVPSGFHSVYDWSADGKFILYTENDPTTNRDIWVLPVDSDQKPYPLFQTPFNETFAQFSPNGRWVAYLSNETGNDELYVARFDNPRERRRISAAGAAQPRWRRDGKELFYLSGDKSLMSVPVQAGDTFEPGEATALFKADSINYNSYDVSPDGQRFLMLLAERTTQSTPFTIVLNWTSDLK